jgi:hypothetical protein
MHDVINTMDASGSSVQMSVSFALATKSTDFITESQCKLLVLRWWRTFWRAFSCNKAACARDTTHTQTHRRKAEPTGLIGSQHTRAHIPPSWQMSGCTTTKSIHRQSQSHIHNHRQHRNHSCLQISTSVCMRTRTRCHSSCNANHHRH